jgi:hypothetical protein
VTRRAHATECTAGRSRLCAPDRPRKTVTLYACTSPGRLPVELWSSASGLPLPLDGLTVDRSDGLRVLYAMTVQWGPRLVYYHGPSPLAVILAQMAAWQEAPDDDEDTEPTPCNWRRTYEP